LRSVSLRILVAAATLAITTLGAPIAHAQAQTAPSAAASSAAPAAADASAAAPAPAAVAPASQPAAAKNGEALDNPYGIEALWKGSDVIARSVLILLAIMSAGSWYILVVKLLEQTKMTRAARTAQARFWQAGTLRDGVASLEKNSAYRFIADSGVSATDDHAGLKRHIPLEDWISMNVQGAVDRVQASTQKGLAFLATVGSTSPFVGLFGTVWGIYHALTAIGISGQASIDKVAGPVGEALIMTAFGLAVAVPAVLGYNWLVRRNKVTMESVRRFGADLHGVLMGARLKAAPAAR
jgi:biopolymer transport protein ExbB